MSTFISSIFYLDQLISIFLLTSNTFSNSWFRMTTGTQARIYDNQNTKQTTTIPALSLPIDPAVMSVEKYLKDLDEESCKNAFLSHLQSPRSSSLKKDNPVVVTEYSCDGQKCSFENVKLAIRESLDLRAYSGSSVALDLVKMIELFPDDFLPHKYDGFQLYRGGFDLMLMKRKESDGSGRTGFIEYNDLRSMALEKSSRDRQQLLESAATKFADGLLSRGDKKGGSCSMM